MLDPIPPCAVRIRAFGRQVLPQRAEPDRCLPTDTFGQYAANGDGRAILIGQVANGRGASWDVQLKGAGQTPYPMGDGARLRRRSANLGSEAMHNLGTRRRGPWRDRSDHRYSAKRESAASGSGRASLRLAPSRFFSSDQRSNRTHADYVTSANPRTRGGTAVGALPGAAGRGGERTDFASAWQTPARAWRDEHRHMSILDSH